MTPLTSRGIPRRRPLFPLNPKSISFALQFLRAPVQSMRGSSPMTNLILISSCRLAKVPTHDTVNFSKVFNINVQFIQNVIFDAPAADEPTQFIDLSHA